MNNYYFPHLISNHLSIPSFSFQFLRSPLPSVMATLFTAHYLPALPISSPFSPQSSLTLRQDLQLNLRAQTQCLTMKTKSLLLTFLPRI